MRLLADKLVGVRAEIELSVLGRQWRNRRLPDFATLETEDAAW